MKDKILKLRAQGQSYRDIVKTVGCSKATVSYYCSRNEKENVSRRNRDRRRIDPLFQKVDNFKQTRMPSGFKIISNKHPHSVLSLRLKMFKIHRLMHHVKFTRNDVVAKFSEHPVCYLTGRKLNFNVPSTYALDHRIPRSRGGDNSLENLEVCCQEANSIKGTFLIPEMLGLCKEILIHHGYQVTGP